MSPNFHTFIHFHPLLVHTSVKNFLYYFSIPLSFNRPVENEVVFLLKFVKCPIAFVVGSQSRKFQVTNSRSANHFCAALSRCSGFETRQKLDRIIGTELRCFPYDCCFFFPPLLLLSSDTISRMVFYTRNDTKNIPNFIANSIYRLLMFAKTESKIVNPMRKWDFRLI